MKVSELIEKLKTFDPDMTVLIADNEYGPEHVTADEEQVMYRYPNEAKVVMLREDYNAESFEQQDIDEKYVIKKDLPKMRQYYPSSPLDGLLKVIYDSSISNQMILFNGKPKPEGGYITFPIHNTRTND